jgi:hypothetical protein
VRVRALAAACVAGATLSLAPAPASGAQGLEIGFHDGAFTSSDSSERTLWLDRAVDARAGIVRIWVFWPRVASTKPATPRNPADPAYDFSELDQGVRDAVSRGLEPMFTTYFAPAWAEGKNRAKNAPPGTWKPNTDALEDFAAALAARYSGTFPGLPRVRYYQDWNEANLSTYLTPQWESGKPVGAEHYRRMNNAFYAGIKSVHKSNQVIGSGLAPYGEPAGGSRTRPLQFWRKVFCLGDRKRLQPRKCVARDRRAHIDIMAHHPINTSGPPSQSALHPDDASSADVGKVTRVLRRAESTGRVLPAGKRELWATEFWWESDPPDRKQGVPLDKHARYIAESMYLAWEGGASAVIALQIRDSDVTQANILERNASGAYFFDGRPKPAFRVYRFPFVADRQRNRKTILWGKAPRTGNVTIERKKGSRWKEIERLRAGKTRIFSGATRMQGGAVLRAKTQGQVSLPWRLR